MVYSLMNSSKFTLKIVGKREKELLAEINE